MATDAELVAAHLAGDPAAMPELWARHEPGVRAAAFRLYGHRRDLDDAVQDVAVRLIEKVHLWDDRASLGTWLSRVTRNVVYDRWRRARVRAAVALDAVPDPVLEEATAAAEAGYARHDDAAQVRALLDVLSPTLLDVVVLVHHDGMSQDAAAAALGIPVGTVKSRCSRGLAELRAAVA